MCYTLHETKITNHGQQKQIINNLKSYQNISNIIKTSNTSNITNGETISRKLCESY